MPKEIIRDYPEEGTRDPIFLLQVKRTIIGDITDDCDYEVNYWDTERVYFTREEAEAYAESRPYHYGKNGDGWRVYCTNSEGQLAELLKQHTRNMP